MAGVTFMALMLLFRQNHVDAAYDTTLSVIRNYRNLSISQSKRYILTFDTPGTITVYYWGKAVPTDPAPVQVASFALPSDIQCVTVFSCGLQSGASQPVVPSVPREILKIGRSGSVTPKIWRWPAMNRVRPVDGSSITRAAVIAQLGRLGHPVDVVTGQGE